MIQQSQHSLLNLSLIESSHTDKIKERKIKDFKKKCFLDTIMQGQRETSQQMNERSINFQQSIHSIHLLKSNTLVPVVS